MASGDTAVNAEFMLQGDDAAAAGVQIFRRADIIRDIRFRDLRTHHGWIVICAGMVCHRNDAGFNARGGNCLLQIGREGGDAAAPGERIADEGDMRKDAGVRDC